MARHWTVEQIPCVSWSGNPRKIVVVHLDDSRFYVLQDSGAKLWRWIMKTGSLESASCSLAKFYELSPASAQRHTLNFARQLAEKNLIVLRPT